MLTEYTSDYLLDKKIKIFQPINGYRASTDAVLLAAFVSGFKGGKILDVGSGTGAVSLCLAQRRLGTKENNVAPCSFDVVISNPPYSEHDLPSPNKSKATAHNHSDFDLRHWLEFCLKAVKPFGKIYIINRAEALPEICSIFSGKAGNLQILSIYSKQKQNAKRILICAQKDSKAPCRLLPPFFTHSDDGSYSEAAQKILRSGLGFDDIV